MRAEKKAKLAQEKGRQVVKKKRQAASHEKSGGESSGSGTNESGRVLRTGMEANIVSDQCCVCNQSFEEDVEIGCGADWVQ